MLFIYYLMKPEDIELKSAYREEVYKKEKSEAIPTDNLEQLGYTKEQIDKIKKDLGKI